MEATADVVVNASRLCFVDPFGMALLGATFHTIRNQGRSVQICGLSAEMGGYLERMDVFEGIELVDCAPMPMQRHNRGDSLVELTRLGARRDVDEASFRLAHAVVGHIPGINPDEPPDEMTGYTAFERLVEPVQYALNELLENALTHAKGHGFPDACVWVASQYYPRKGMIQLAVVDDGCGFLASLRNHPALRRESHIDAIFTALMPRISCNRDLGLSSESVNQGVGLTTTFRIAEQAGGRLVIASGDAIHDTVGRSYQLTEDNFWQGVAVAMECRRDRLPDIRFRDLLPPLDAQPVRRLRFE